MQSGRIITRARHAGVFLLETISLSTPRGRISAFSLIGILGVLLSWGWFAWVPTLSLYERLGIPSPSIGLTEAFIALVSGDIAGAYARNWLIFPVVVIALAILAYDVRRIRQRMDDAE